MGAVLAADPQLEQHGFRYGVCKPNLGLGLGLCESCNVKVVRSWLRRSAEDRASLREQVSRKLHRLQAVQVDIGQPLRRGAEDYADVLRLAVEVLRRIIRTDAERLPRLQLRLLCSVRNGDGSPSSANVGLGESPGRLNGFQLARIVQDRFTACGSSLSRERLGPVRLTLLRARYSSQSRTS